MTVPLSSRGAPIARAWRPKRPAQPLVHGYSFRQWDQATLEFLAE
jgi:hypothetical protein